MRVLLLNPPAVAGISYVREGRCEQRLSSFQYNMVPISLLTTAALLRREGHTVAVIDAIARNLGLAALIEELRAFSPDLVLFNVATASFRGDARSAAAIRDACPAAYLVAYGVHVTALPEQSLQEAPFDGVIRREPEVTAAALARALADGSRLESVVGFSFRTPRPPGPGAQVIVHNPDRPFLEDLDSLPFPARDLVDHRWYPAPVDGRPHTLLITSRGCPYPCTYCTAHLYYGSRPRLRSPARIVDEVEQVVRDQGLGLFTLWADTFSFEREQVLGICRELGQREVRIEWMANSRADRIDVDLLRAMRASGCRVVSIGVESGVQTILDRVRKGVRVEQIAAAFAACRAAGVRSAAHVILGLPGETPATIRQTLRFVRRIRPDYVQFYGAIPFPGTAFHREARERGWILATDWPEFEINRCIVSTPDLSAEELRRWRRRAYLTSYLHPRFLAARLAELRSPRDLVNLARAGSDFLRGWVLPSR